MVKAGNGSITVTGTRFNVWKYQDNVVTVTEGSVKVRSEGSGNDSSLTPGMQASYYPGLLQPLVEAVDTRQTLAWREGRLVLDDLPLSKALPLINRYLDARWSWATGALRNCALAGSTAPATSAAWSTPCRKSCPWTWNIARTAASASAAVTPSSEPRLNLAALASYIWQCPACRSSGGGLHAPAGFPNETNP